MFWARRTPVSLLVALLLYLGLARGAVTGVGAVGEVGASWLEQPPAVAVRVEGGEVSLGRRTLGPLEAGPARPLERLVIGSLALPLAVNQYTGGPPDWPARLVWGLSRSLDGVVALHVGLGALLLVLVHRFLRFHGTDVAAAVAALVLACDWSFVFYRKVLGGTEVLLQAAGLLVLWAFWSRRWSGGRHGSVAIAVGAGLGLLAKATFAATLGAFALAALLTRWDRPALKPPPAPRWWAMLTATAVCVTPLIISWLHHGPGPPPLRSHDYLSFQLERALDGLGGAAASRESAASLLWFAADPLAWFGPGLGAPRGSSPSWPRLAGWALLAAGVAMEWRRRGNSPSSALLRFLSIYAPLQTLALWVANRDLHHLAQAAPTWCLLFGLAADRLAAPVTQPRSPLRALYGLILATTWMVGGARALLQTDAVVAQVPAPVFAEARQAALAGLLREHRVERLVTSDYELYGLIELLSGARGYGGPAIAATHGWGLLSTRRGRPERLAALGELLAAGAGGHYLSVRRTAPRTYDLEPREGELAALAEAAGVAVSPVGELRDERGPWARLYALTPLE